MHESCLVYCYSGMQTLKFACCIHFKEQVEKTDPHSAEYPPTPSLYWGKNKKKTVEEVSEKKIAAVFYMVMIM